METLSITTTVPSDWEGRRRIASDRLDELRQARGVATIEGKAFDHRTIHEAEAELDGIAAAQVEAERRRRESYDAEIDRRREDLRARLRESLEARSKALIEGEAALETLASALTILFEESREADSLMRALDIRSQNIVEQNVRLRAACRIAYALGPVCGKTMGGIIFPVVRAPALPDGTKASDSWHDSDAMKLGADIARALPKQENDHA